MNGAAILGGFRDHRAWPRERPWRRNDLTEQKWQQISKETLLQNPYYRLSYDQYYLPDGSVGNYTYVDIPGSTMVVPELPDGRLVLVRQHRYLMGRTSLEFPAGGLPAGRDPLDNARNELREEAGYEAGDWLKLGEFAPYNGVSNEMCHVYRAAALVEVGAEPEPTEEIEICEFTVDELLDQVERGDLWDGMTLACLRVYESWKRRNGEA